MERKEKTTIKHKEYQNYFVRHYKSSLSKKDIFEYEKWFFAQWGRIKSILSLKKKTKILEIGSGLGGFYTMLSKDIKDITYTGIELDKEACDIASSFFGKGLFMHTSFEDFKAKKESYDYIFAFEVLEHVHSPRDFIVKIHTLLKPGGIFIGTSPYPFAKNIAADNTHLFVLHPHNWERLFSLAGFKKMRHEPMSFLPFAWRLHKRLNMRIPFYLPFPQFISTTLLIAKK